MDHLADAPSSPRRKPIIDTAIPHAASPLALLAVAVLVLYAIARLSDPTYGGVPIRDAPGRVYYLFALLLLAALVVAETTLRTLSKRELLRIVAGNVLLVGAATLLFVGHRGTAVVVAMLALALLDGWTRQGARSAAVQPIFVVAGTLLTVLITWIFVLGLLEFHFRWLYALPLAVLAGAAAFIRIEAGSTRRALDLLLGLTISGLALAQLIVATSFLNVHAGVGATLAVASLSAIFGVHAMTTKRNQS